MPHTPSSEKALLLDKHAYQISHLIAGFTVPLMRKLYHQFDGDMVQMIIFGEISLHNVSHFFRKGGADVPEKLLDDMELRNRLLIIHRVCAVWRFPSLQRSWSMSAADRQRLRLASHSSGIPTLEVTVGLPVLRAMLMRASTLDVQTQ
jgi:hypothetical protein